MLATEKRDPRVERSVAAVLGAARGLLIEGGASAITVDAVVERAGVARTTVYRHWPSRDALVAATFESLLPEFTPCRVGDRFDAALDDLVAQLIRFAADEYWQRLMPSLLEVARLNRQVARIHAGQRSSEVGTVRAVVELGVAEGALRPDIDVEWAALALVGPVIAACVLGTSAIDRDFGRYLVANFLAAHGS